MLTIEGFHGLATFRAVIFTVSVTCPPVAMGCLLHGPTLVVHNPLIETRQSTSSTGLALHGNREQLARPMLPDASHTSHPTMSAKPKGTAQRPGDNLDVLGPFFGMNGRHICIALLDVKRAERALEAALVAVRARVELRRVRNVDDVVCFLVVQPAHHDRLEKAAKRCTSEQEGEAHVTLPVVP